VKFSLLTSLIFLQNICFGLQVSDFSDYEYPYLDARLDTIKKNRQDKNIFIETGTSVGGGVLMALLSGFQEVHSMEIVEEKYEIAKEMVGRKTKGVHLYLGDSSELLPNILAEIKEPVLFWLDAHSSEEKATVKWPILNELSIIAAHPIKTHTILIDDVRCFGSSDFDEITLAQIKEILLQINPMYEITFEPGYIDADVLVAKIN